MSPNRARDDAVQVGGPICRWSPVTRPTSSTHRICAPRRRLLAPIAVVLLALSVGTAGETIGVQAARPSSDQRYASATKTANRIGKPVKTTTTLPPVTTTSQPAATTTTTQPATTTTTTQLPVVVEPSQAVPFAADSPWNIGVGPGAQFRSATDWMTSNLLSSAWTPWVNAGQYSHPVIEASASDPIVSMTCDYISGLGHWATTQFRMPLDATAAPGTDGHLHVISPDRTEVVEMFQVRGSGSQRTCNYLVRNDLRSSGFGDGGTRAHGGSAIGGLIRSDELDGSPIPHALAVAISAGQLARGFVWPATAEDGDAATSYYGSIPMGTFLAIPASVDVGALGLSPEGRAVALAFQQYGGYVVDRASGVMLYTEPLLEGSAQLDNLRRDMRTLVGQLRIVSNNSPQSVNGGGHL